MKKSGKSLAFSLFACTLLMGSSPTNAAELWTEGWYSNTNSQPQQLQPVGTKDENAGLLPNQEGTGYTQLWTEDWYDTTDSQPQQPSPPVYPPPTGQTLINFDVQPRMENGRSLVPLRKIFEVLGAEVEWINETSTIIAVKETRIIKLKLGSKTAYINNQAVALDVPPKAINGQTLVPLRFVSEALGYTVDYNSQTKKVVIDGRFYFYIGNSSVPNTTNGKTTSSNTEKPSSSTIKAFTGKWTVYVSGGWTAPDPTTGISTYTKGQANGSMTINSNGTWVWDAKSTVYKGTWKVNPDNAEQILLHSNDGWDYTAVSLGPKAIKWFSYGVEYHGSR